jgi:hypothetical protein
VRESFTEKACSECEGTGKVRVRTKSGHGRRARRKGNRAELKIAKRIGGILGIEYKDLCRTPNSGALIERSDLRMSNAVRDRFPVYVEVKNREEWTLDNLLEVREKWIGFRWLAEARLKLAGEVARGSSPEGLLPVVILVKNFRDPLVLWSTRDFFGQSILCLCIRVGVYRIAPLDDFVKTVLDAVAKGQLAPEPVAGASAV